MIRSWKATVDGEEGEEEYVSVSVCVCVCVFFLAH